VVGLVLLAAFGLRARRVTFDDIGQGLQVPGEFSPPGDQRVGLSG